MIKKGIPIRLNSKKEKLSKPLSANALLTMIFGGVPVNVNNPPVLDPKATGIKNFEGKVPILHADEMVKGIKVARQAKAMWKETYEERTDPFGRTYYWMSGIFLDGDQRPDTDENALKENYVALVPVQYDFTAGEWMKKLKF